MNGENTVPGCWVLSEGHAGMENQAIGLAEALGFPFDIRRVRPRAPWTWLPSGHWPWPMLALRHDSHPLTAPWPDVIISSGRRSVPYSMYVGRAADKPVFRIHIQNPQCDLRNFDLVLTPEHDHLSGPNVISTLGSLHRITPERIAMEAAEVSSRRLFLKFPRPLVGVMIGGTNSHYRVDEEVVTGLAQSLVRLARETGMGLVVTPSRRTGQRNIELLRQILQPVGAYVWDFIGVNPYFGILSEADYLLVTRDSVSMTSEAASTGKPVYVIDLPGKSRKFDEFHQVMQERGYTRRFDGKLESWRYEPLQETRRVAREIFPRYHRWKEGNGKSGE